MSVELKDVRAINSMENSARENPAFVGSTDSVTSADSSNNDNNNDALRRRPVDLEVIETTVITTVIDDDDDDDLNACSRIVNTVQDEIVNFYKEHDLWIWRIVKILIAILYFIYFTFAMRYRFGDEGSIRLLVITIVGVLLVVRVLVWDSIRAPLDACGNELNNTDNATKLKVIRWILYVVCLIAIIVILVVEVAIPTPWNLISLAGLAGFIIFCYLFSMNPGRVNWHPIFWGLALQFFFAAIILRTLWGYHAFKWLGDRVTEFLAHADAGAEFVFGNNFRVHFFAFALMPVVTFFSSFISLLYYLGVMQAVVGVLGRFLSFCLGTTPAESLNAAGNIFVGMTEAPLMIRPFLHKMTISELHAVMTGGFATIAGSVLGAYIGFGVPANHLLSASVMSAPAALAISKLMCPETEKTIVSSDDYYQMGKSEERNMIEAAAEGATVSARLIANILVNLIAFLAMLAFINATLHWLGARVGIDLSFEIICSYVLYPVALFMGTQPSDCRRVAELVGVKTFTNEFIAYERLKVLLENRQTFLNYTQTYNETEWYWDGADARLIAWNQTLVGGFMEERSEVISTYALCGFANVGSMGILLGGLTALAPERKSDLASIVFRAMISGNIACFFTACIAGLFYREF